MEILGSAVVLGLIVILGVLTLVIQELRRLRRAVETSTLSLRATFDDRFLKKLMHLASNSRKNQAQMW